MGPVLMDPLGAHECSELTINDLSWGTGKWVAKARGQHSLTLHTYQPAARPAGVEADIAQGGYLGWACAGAPETGASEKKSEATLPPAPTRRTPWQEFVCIRSLGSGLMGKVTCVQVRGYRRREKNMIMEGMLCVS